jgi:hypothetical protein
LLEVVAAEAMQVVEVVLVDIEPTQVMLSQLKVILLQLERAERLVQAVVLVLKEETAEIVSLILLLQREVGVGVESGVVVLMALVPQRVVLAEVVPLHTALEVVQARCLARLVTLRQLLQFKVMQVEIVLP